MAICRGLLSLLRVRVRVTAKALHGSTLLDLSRPSQIAAMLELRFSTRGGLVQVSCDEAHLEDLQALRSRFASAVTINQLTFDLEIDDLLVNLHELARWPNTDGDVRWQPELLHLVE